MIKGGRNSKISPIVEDSEKQCSPAHPNTKIMLNYNVSKTTSAGNSMEEEEEKKSNELVWLHKSHERLPVHKCKDVASPPLG